MRRKKEETSTKGNPRDYPGRALRHFRKKRDQGENHFRRGQEEGHRKNQGKSSPSSKPPARRSQKTTPHKTSNFLFERAKGGGPKQSTKPQKKPEDTKKATLKGKINLQNDPTPKRHQSSKKKRQRAKETQEEEHYAQGRLN